MHEDRGRDRRGQQEKDESRSPLPLPSPRLLKETQEPTPIWD
jgi:hypothetical protein